MLDRQHGKIIFECEGCGETLETGETDFAEAKGVLDDNSWKARKIGVDWCHYCPECAG